MNKYVISKINLKERLCTLNTHSRHKTPHEKRIQGHYKIFCVNGNTGFRNESRIFYFIHLQNEEDYERKESSSA